MNLLVISASQRCQSQSAKVGAFFADYAQQVGFETEHLDLIEFDLPYWDGADESLESVSDWQTIRPLIDQADAYVLITPEWDGTASPLLKNFLLMTGTSNTAHKPVLLTSVVAQISGAYPIAELRANAFKNNHMVPTPEHLIIRSSNLVLNGARIENDRDASIRQRIAHSLTMLAGYATALQSVQKLAASQPIKPYGM